MCSMSTGMELTLQEQLCRLCSSNCAPQVMQLTWALNHKQVLDAAFQRCEAIHPCGHPPGMHASRRSVVKKAMCQNYRLHRSSLGTLLAPVCCTVEPNMCFPCWVHLFLSFDCQSPIEGARHRCLTCAHYNLCSSCFSSGQHLQHSFACQPTPTAPDQIAERPGSAAMAGMFQIGGLLQCSGDRGGACRSTAAGGIGSGIGSVTPLSSGRSSADCDGNGGSSHPTDGAAAAPVTAVLQVQFASRRASCSSNTDSRRPRDSGGGTPDISSDVDGGIRRGRCQQHMQQQCRRQQTASRPLEQLQQQDFFVGTGRAALSTLQQQQQQHHGSPAQHLCRFPIPKRSCPSPTAAGAAAIVREVQSLAISGSGAAAHLLSSQLEHHPSTSCGQESSGKQERQQPLKAPACRISGLVGGVAPALGQQQQQQQPLTLQLIGTAPITDVHTSAYDTTARSSAIASGPAATPNSLSASNIGRIRDRTTRRTTAQAVAATGQEEKPLGTKTFNRDSGVNSGSSSTAVRSSRGLRLQQGSKCPSGSRQVTPS